MILFCALVLLHFSFFSPSIKSPLQTALSTVYIEVLLLAACSVVCVVFCLCSLLVGRGRMRSHPSPANSHQSGPMLEPLREEAIAHSTGAHSPSTQGGHGHLTHQGPVYFSLRSHATVHMCVCDGACFHHCTCLYVC